MSTSNSYKNQNYHSHMDKRVPTVALKTELGGTMSALQSRASRLNAILIDMQMQAVMDEEDVRQVLGALDGMNGLIDSVSMKLKDRLEKSRKKLGVAEE